MIYIITILVLLALVFHFDINGNTRYKITAYYILMFWFIAVSGFQYCIGSDMPPYMYEYDAVQWKDVTWDSITGLNNRQLGWILLINFCKLISKDFVVLKIIQAIFLNVAFFTFFKRQTKALFTSILFYSLYLYLDLNFNILRQSIAVGIFLLGYTFYAEKNWLKYYICVFSAIMFHNTAAILIFLPLLHLIKINRNSLILLSISFFICLVGIRYLPVTDFLLGHLSIFMNSDVALMADWYLTDEKYGKNSVSLISYMVVAMLYFWVIFFNYRNNMYKYKYDLLIIFTYIFILALNTSIPIFARLNYYFIPIFIYLLSNFIINFPKLRLEKRLRLISVVFLVVLFSYSSVIGLFRINTSYDDKNIVQYYPYYTVFNKKVSPLRAKLWGAYY